MMSKSKLSQAAPATLGQGYSLLGWQLRSWRSSPASAYSWRCVLLIRRQTTLPTSLAPANAALTKLTRLLITQWPTSKATKASLVFPVQMVSKARQGSRAASRDRRVTKVVLALAALKDQLAQLALLAKRVVTVHRALKERKVLKARKAQRVTEARLAQMAQQVHKAPKVHRGHQGRSRTRRLHSLPVPMTRMTTSNRLSHAALDAHRVAATPLCQMTPVSS